MKKEFIILLGIFMLFGFVAAEYDITDNSISTIYPKGTFLSGWIQISFENHSLDSLFEDNLDNQVTLEEVLNQSTNYVYSCKNNDCESSYSKKNPSIEKDFLFQGEGTSLIGIVFDKNIEIINTISFNLTSNATSSSQNQIKIDFFDDGITEAGNTNYGLGVGTEVNYGCFDSNEDVTEISLGSNAFCQRIELDEAPAFMVGAWLKKITAGDINITLELYDDNGILLDECLLEDEEISGDGSEVFCPIYTAVAQKEDYYLCLQTEGTGSYKTLGYQSSDNEKNCGFVGIPVRNEENAYSIGAKTIDYGPVGTIEISNELPSGGEISVLVEDYLEDEYGSMDCSTNDCYVPIRISSFANQDVNINSIYINYDAYGLPGIEETQFYDFEEEPAEISSTSQKLYLDKLFKLPSETGEINYKLDFEGEEIFDEDINIEEITITLYPMTAASNFPTTFEINFDPDFNFSSYKWDFGDGTALQTSQGNKKSHTYSNIGNYTLNVAAKTLDGSEFSKSFEIKVESPENTIQNTIQEIERNLETLKQQVSLLDSFEREQFYKRINLDEIETNLSYIKENAELASNDLEYKQVIGDLMSIRIPKAIIQVPTNKISYYPQPDNVNLNILEEITNETSGDFEDTTNSILIWNQNNINSKISMREILVKWDSSTESFFRTFELSITPLYTQDEDFYFVIKEIDGLDFRGNISFQEESGYYYLPIIEPITIQFSTSERLDFLSLPMFISPDLEKVKVEKIEPIEEENRLAILIVIFIILIFIGIMIYVFLQKWYKNKYEKYLFKERNQLYNVATYIHNSKDNNVPDSEIRNTLRKAGWNNEQITYALRKYAGKRTGMYELPIKKLLDKKEKEQKQQQEDTKFNKGYYPN